MAGTEDSEAHSPEFHNAEEALEDKDSVVFDTILLNDSVEAAKRNLKTLQQQGHDTHGVLGSYFFYFFVEQTPSYPKFVEWFINNYSPSEGVIMDGYRSKILCPISSLVV